MALPDVAVTSVSVSNINGYASTTRFGNVSFTLTELVDPAATFAFPNVAAASLVSL